MSAPAQHSRIEAPFSARSSVTGLSIAAMVIAACVGDTGGTGAGPIPQCRGTAVSVIAPVAIVVR